MGLSLRLMNFFFDSFTNTWGRLAEYLSPLMTLSPLVLRIRITNRCNLSCHYCYVGNSLNKKVNDLLTFDEWTKIIDKLPRKTLIDITGGEPFLTPRFDEIMDLFLNRKFKVSLITNGTVSKDGLLEKLVEKKMSHFMISLDGNETIHDSIRGKGNFNKAIQSARKVIFLKKQTKTSHPKVVAKVTVTEDNAPSIKDFSSYLLNDVGFDGVTLNLLFQNKARDGFADSIDHLDEKFFSGNTVTFDPSKIEELTNSISETVKAFPSKVQIRPEMKINEIRSYFQNPSQFSPAGCFKYRSVVTIYSDGVLTPCDLGLDVGNIREIDYDISDSFKLKRNQAFFRFLKKKKSENLPGCGGCCLKKHQLIA